METQTNVFRRSLSVFFRSITEAGSSTRKVGRIIPMLCVLSTLAGCSSPTAEQQEAAVAQLPAEEQVEAVAKKLQELNPGFDGKTTPTIFKGVVVGLQFCTDNVTDISPVRALAGLKNLSCGGSSLSNISSESGLVGSGKLVDLTPLKGMPLTELDCGQTQVTDLTPLKGMPLTTLTCRLTQVSDLTPLNGMPLTMLYCEEMSSLWIANHLVAFAGKARAQAVQVMFFVSSLQTIEM